MKNHIKYFLFFSLSLLIISCSKDDSEENENDSETTIFGKWSLIESNVNGEINESNDCTKKSIIEFKEDNTYKDIAVFNDEDSNTCIYDGFGTSGSFVLKDETLVRTAIEVIAIPEEFNNPEWIEEAKGEFDTETISFEDENLIISLEILDGSEIFTFKSVYQKTTDAFFTEE